MWRQAMDMNGSPTDTTRLTKRTMDWGSYPNVFREMVLEQASPATKASATLPYETDKVIKLVSNIDNDTAHARRRAR